MELPEQPVQVLHVPQRITHHDEIKRRRAKRQYLAQSLDQRNGMPLSVFCQHAPARVEPDQLAGRDAQLERGLRHQTGACGNVEDPHARLQPRRLENAPAIRPVGAERHRAAHPVVIPGGPVEQFAHESGPLRRRRIEFRQRSVRGQFRRRSAGYFL